MRTCLQTRCIPWFSARMIANVMARGFARSMATVMAILVVTLGTGDSYQMVFTSMALLPTHSLIKYLCFKSTRVRILIPLNLQIQKIMFPHILHKDGQSKTCHRQIRYTISQRVNASTQSNFGRTSILRPWSLVRIKAEPTFQVQIT